MWRRSGQNDNETAKPVEYARGPVEIAREPVETTRLLVESERTIESARANESGYH